ncbi:MAG: TolC family protein [gamma proteobacterium symbiont of Lucinoma myriamae]|nr:TolC family protein [gamma proteobacterium symbiont of Lucinoma myriamae]
MPDFKKMHYLSITRELPEVEELYETAYQNNPRLISKNHKLDATRFKLDAYQAEKYPVISARLQAADYAREMGSSDKYRAGIEFKIPLYQAGQENAKIKRTAGKIIQLKADRLIIKRELEQQILELWLKISNLKQQFSDPDFTMEYRDLYLERSRA